VRSKGMPIVCVYCVECSIIVYIYSSALNVRPRVQVYILNTYIQVNAYEDNGARGERVNTRVESVKKVRGDAFGSKRTIGQSVTEYKPINHFVVPFRPQAFRVALVNCRVQCRYAAVFKCES
jgi:hypothetical protein